MMLIPESPMPVNSCIEVNYPIEKVKNGIEELLRDYPKYFIVGKNGCCSEIGTYVFTRPKGINTPTLRITLSQINDLKTKIDINSSSSSFMVDSPDLQIAITEVYNIFIAKLKNFSEKEIKKVIKQNNSGNGVWGCVKTFGCGLALLFMMIIIVVTFIRCIINII